MGWAKTTARGYKKHLSFGICATYIRGFTVLFISLTLYFDGKLSSVSMPSWPPMISKSTMCWSSTLWSWFHNAGELSANHTLQRVTTMYQYCHWQVLDWLWCWCDGSCMAKSYWQNIKITFKFNILCINLGYCEVYFLNWWIEIK